MFSKPCATLRVEGQAETIKLCVFGVECYDGYEACWVVSENGKYGLCQYSEWVQSLGVWRRALYRSCGVQKQFPVVACFVLETLHLF